MRKRESSIAHKFILAGIMTTSILISSNINAVDIKFTDLKETHWATENILWAVNKGIIKGYEDGTYRKDKDISEGEFASIVHGYGTNTKNLPIGKAKEGGYWADPIYENLSKFKLPFKKKGKEPITRGEIAVIIASMYDFKLTEAQAIEFMYENDFSNGVQAGKTVESYGKDRPVKREQIPKFMKALMDKEGPVTFREVESSVKPGEIGDGEGQTFPDDKPVTPEKPVTPPSSGDIEHGVIHPSFSYAKPIAEKYGGRLDSDETGFEVTNDKNRTRVDLEIRVDGGFGGSAIKDYKKDKEMARELYKESKVMGDGKVVDEIMSGLDEYMKSKGTPFYKELSNGKELSVKAGNTGDMFIQILG